MRTTLPCLMLVLAAALAGCAERDQNKSASNTNRDDAAPFSGAKNSFVAAGWKPGEKGDWEAQMRRRVMTQNEYNKTN
ncbi:hypothetical protein [Noviherbaspirillum galbum]|uniref:Lipoprotein n=1 Tax=Noviherbaspirillum galbum TaxID=2709383 RepID=A0A6B3SV00_9BURK|nr:hypothetical protein [Noviherbaspirillum galbum]NEX63205.1 hypothetical protein [Noviherbaspirillum galbum]